MQPWLSYTFRTFQSLYNSIPEIPISYGNSESSIQIYRVSEQRFSVERRRAQPEVVWKSWRSHKIPVLFSESPDQPLMSLCEGKVIIHDDIFASAFYLLSGWQEYEYLDRLPSVRYPFEQSIQNRESFTQIPVVNEYFEILKAALEHISGQPIQRRTWQGSPMAFCLTHDIDTCLNGWKQDLFHQVKQGKLGSIWPILRQRMQNHDTWFTFSRIMALEKSFNATSSFYFIPNHQPMYVLKDTQPGQALAETHRLSVSQSEKSRYRRLNNADYQMTDTRIRAAMDFIQAEGFEVGVHGSFLSHLEKTKFAQELETFPLAVSGGRFHYLYFDRRHSFDILSSSGLAYDSTLGFAERPGFRNGIAHPFFPFDLIHQRVIPTLEIPLTMMDTTFRIYMKTPRKTITQLAEAQLDRIKALGGCCTILWHNNYFSDYKYAGWEESYASLLRLGQSKGAWMRSGTEIDRYWRAHPALQSMISNNLNNLPLTILPG